MEAHSPSRTAQGAAMHRAAHQLFDNPAVFADPLALRIIGKASAQQLRDGTVYHSRREAAGMRAFLVARSRFTEDCLAAAMARGVRQYVLLGAGLDTFAYRTGKSFPDLAIYEVDHPATQAWKRARLLEEGIAIAPNVTYAPVNFESETLAAGLGRAGFDFSKPALFAWLGVVPYLTRDAVMATLGFVAHETAKGSEVAFDYPEPFASNDPALREKYAARMKRFRDIGEPLLSAFEPAALTAELIGMGFSEVEDFDLAQLNARYFEGRKDGLKMNGRGHLLKARV